jgi:hypothetical protein
MPIQLNPDGGANVTVPLVTWHGGCPIKKVDRQGHTVIGRLDAGQCLPPDTPTEEVAKLINGNLVTLVTVTLNAEQVAKAREISTAKEN